MNAITAFTHDPPVRRPRPVVRAALTVSVVAAIAAMGLAAPGSAMAEDRLQRSASVADVAVEHAKRQVGKAYRFGAAGPDAFDCSGLVQWAYGEAGKKLPRTTYDQFTEGESVSREELLPGDLVFFYSGPGHVGIYIGDDRMVHAPSTGKSVQIVDMAAYFFDQMVGARRIVEPSSPGPGAGGAPPGKADHPKPPTEADVPKPRGASDDPRPPRGADVPKPRGGSDSPRPPREVDVPKPAGASDVPKPRGAAGYLRPPREVDVPEPLGRIRFPDPLGP
ncbi:C40 family peptidase [Nocardiopsis mangrovi]|uniref:C40 family peptidase n=1 Tax=Nocardiopsis mangrovi TaxID=1179818 RepID=A0ABV9E3D8_9ACTN